MSSIIADDNLKAQLNGLTETVEVRESSGRLLGQFLPQAEYRRLVLAWAKTLHTDEELDTLETEAAKLPFMSLDELLKEINPS